MRILVLASHFPRPTNRTMGVWALKQAQALATLGHDVRVVSMTDWVPGPIARLSKSDKLISRAMCPATADWDGLPVEYPRWPRYHAGPHMRLAYAHPAGEMAFAIAFARRRVDRIVDGFRPDVIYAHGTVVNGALGLGPARRHGIPLVCHDHDHAEIRDCERLPARRRHFRAVAGGADALLVVNSQMVKMVSRVAPELRPQILPEGADIRPDPPTAHRTPGLAVFCASTFTARKQIPLLIEAFAQVAVAHPGARLRIAGDGPERPQVEERIARHGLQERVELLGFVDPDRVLAEMHQADVFALLSRDEPFATVYCEAMAARLPIVCTADGGITDAVRDGVHGRVVGPNDSTAAAEAINGLLADPAARRQMGEAGRQLVGSELTWDANARRAGDLFAQIVARRRTREGPSSRRDA